MTVIKRWIRRDVGGNTHTLLLGKESHATTLENTSSVPQKVK
jgi:hypothetical protein